jgi:hypothetical protein
MFYRKRVVLIDRDAQFQDVLKYVLGSIDKILIVNQYTECVDALKSLDRDPGYIYHGDRFHFFERS